MKRKVFAFVIAVVVLAVLATVLVGCDKDVRLGDIFVNYRSAGEITHAELQLTLPAGWNVLTDSTTYADSDIGYSESLDAYIVVNSAGSLNIARADENKETVFMLRDSAGNPTVSGISAIKIYGTLALIRFNNNTASVINLANGRTVVKQSDTVGISEKVTEAVSVLDSELVAVNPAYSTVCTGTDYTPVYRVSTGELVFKVYNKGGSLDCVYGFDGRYVLVENQSGTSSSKEYASYLYSVPEKASSALEVKPSEACTYDRASEKDDYYSEATYLGEGKFYVHEEWTVSSSDDYTYSYSGEYYKVYRYIVTPENGQRTAYNSSYYFLNCVNSYFEKATSRCSVAPTSFLQPGYIYSSFGLYVPESKEAEYDQFVLDKDLNVVLSLTNNWGIELEYVERDVIGVYDLLLQFQDGYGFAPLAPSALRLFDGDGKIVLEEKQYPLSAVNVHDGMIIAQTVKDSKTLYGAFDMNGELVIPFEYSYIEAFRGYYTYAVRASDSTAVLLGRDGSVLEYMSDGSKPLSDIAVTGNKTKIQKRGCYMYTTTTADGTTVYGIKNYNADVESNVVLEAQFLKGCTLYSPSIDANSVFVFGQTEESGPVKIYRLLSDEEGNPAALPVWAWVLIGLGCAAAAAGAVTGIVFGVRASRRKKASENVADETVEG